ncbi:MAG: hypothetical protein CL891_01420 [Dehalococcoidia bacterium]|nr:hypothetical protein [Dehalococcoidia bacterium]
MGSRMQTGLFLIIGTIVSLIGWMFIYPGGGGPDSTAAENAASLMADPGLSKLGMLMGFGGMGAVFIGLLNISRKMAAGEGAGASYANICAILALALVIMGIFTIGIEWGVTEASSSVTGTDLMEISMSGNTSFGLTMGLLLLLLGISIILEKNFHIVIGGLAVIAGVISISSIAGFPMGGFIGWIGMMLVALGLGVQVLRSKS